MRFLSRLQGLLKHCALLLVVISFTSPGTAAPKPALNNWHTALLTFQKAGALVGEAKYPQARAELSRATSNLAAPYSTIAGQHLDQLEAALKLSAKKESAEQLAALADLCGELRAYPAALKFLDRLRKLSPEDEGKGVSRAWCLFETDKVKAAIAEYERKANAEAVAMWKSYYRKQIELLQKRATNSVSAALAIEFVQEHYLKGYETKPDGFGALAELARVLPATKDPKEQLSIYQMIIKNLSTLDDDLGTQAWEDTLLAAFRSDRDACAAVFLDRGLRAFQKKNYPEALALFRQVCAEYPDAAAYGDAQYDAGLVLHEQQKYSEAISEYDKLLLSQLNDSLPEPSSSEDAKNYHYKAAMRISECYESQKDYARALDYSVLARDRYKFVGWCQICLDNVRNQLAQRIQKLQGLAKPDASGK